MSVYSVTRTTVAALAAISAILTASLAARGQSGLPPGWYAETITIKSQTGAVLDTRSASAFAGGVYYVWSVSGSVTVTLTSTAGSHAVLSGIFFG